MSRLTIYPDNNPSKHELDTTDAAVITKALKDINVHFERAGKHLRNLPAMQRMQTLLMPTAKTLIALKKKAVTRP